MSLPILVSQEKWQEFDDAWRALMTSGGPVDEVVVALKLAGDKKRISRCVAMAREHAESLAETRPGDAARVLGAVLVAGGNPAEVASRMHEFARTAWSGETWWEPYTRLAGLTEEATDLRAPWRAFAKLCAFQPGSLIHHPGGWGAGEVLSISPEKLEMEVRFWNGRTDTFPLNAAVDIFEPLRSDDLRAEHYRDPEGIPKRAKKEPLEVLRTIVLGHNGRATTALVRNALMLIGIEGSAWSAWWRKARKQAENSEWFEVTGTPQKSVITLLLSAKDPAAALHKQLTRAGSLAEVHSKVRDLFVGETPDARLLEVGLEILEQRAGGEDEPLHERLAAWLLLREQAGSSLEIMTEALQEVLEAPPPADPSVPPALFSLFQGLPGVRDQERAVELLPELFGEAWMDNVAPHLPHAAPGQVRLLVEAFERAGRAETLKAHYAGLLARPLRAPGLLVTLASMFEDGSELAGYPTAAQRAQALLNLATHLHSERRGDPHLTRVCARMTDLLAKGPEPLLRRLLSGTDTGVLRSITLIVQRGVDPEIDHMVTELALEHDRHFFAAQSGPFWESDDVIWSTRRGIETRSAELRELREVKIPENEDAIGRAASYGDISENAEWEAAMEEQRNLTTRAMAIEDELRLADLIEDAPMPEDTICPGAVVAFREAQTGEQRKVIILGPWDDETWNGVQVVSYRAPLASGLLGLHSGDRVTVVLPAGELPVEVIGIETPELD